MRLPWTGLWLGDIHAATIEARFEIARGGDAPAYTAKPGPSVAASGCGEKRALVSRPISGLKRNREAAQLKPRHPPTCAISQT
jgi:hypothetical protein